MVLAFIALGLEFYSVPRNKHLSKRGVPQFRYIVYIYIDMCMHCIYAFEIVYIYIYISLFRNRHLWVAKTLVHSRSTNVLHFVWMNPCFQPSMHCEPVLRHGPIMHWKVIKSLSFIQDFLDPMKTKIAPFNHETCRPCRGHGRWSMPLGGMRGSQIYTLEDERRKEPNAITHEKKGKWSSKTSREWCSMLIVGGVQSTTLIKCSLDLGWGYCNWIHHKKLNKP